MAIKEMRWCEDIGMFAVDRPIDTIPGKAEGSCVWATDFCKSKCYNEKLYKLYPDMRLKDIRNEQEWQSASAEDYANSLARKKKQVKRWRLMTRGEAIKDHSDVDRIIAIAEATPDSLLWIPTRAWRDPELRERIRKELMPLKNLAVLASIDPETREEEQSLLDDGWSTMFFGDDEDTEGRFKCPKTWKKMKGHCGICKAGCFAPKLLNRQVRVHLSEH
jgi:hypothetical protein